MKKFCLAFSIALISLTTSQKALAQVAGNAIVSNLNNGYSTPPVDLSINSYSSNFSSLLEANVMVNVKASSYTAIFSLTQVGKTVEETELQMRTRCEIFRSMLQQKDMGVMQVFIDPVSIVPTYETEVTEKKLSRTFNEVPTGFEMKKNIHVTFRQQDQINDIITEAAKAEVYDLVKVDYNVENKDQVLEQLRDEALRILLSKKEVLEKAGIHTRFINVGEMQSSAFPAERYAQYYAYKSGAAPYYATRKDKPGTTVQYNYADKQKTVYYDKVTDKQFDKVINPVVSEPMVQIYFSLKGQYSIYDPQAEDAEKTYNEKLKQLRLLEMETNIEVKKRPVATTPVVKKK